MSKPLSPKEIYDRMIRLRNLERLHTAQKERNVFLEQDNRLLCEINAEQAQAIEALQLRVEELEKMVFKKKKKEKVEEETKPKDKDPDSKPPRSSSSYHRPLPKEDEITERVTNSIGQCPDCHAPLEQKTAKICYEEDIALAAKSVTRHTIEKGYCQHCKHWKSSVLIPSTNVFLGKNVQCFIGYLSVMSRLSFESIRNLLLSAYHLEISDGEIAKILKREALRLRPEYEHLKETIRSQPAAHYDETSWKVQEETQGNYAWVMASASSPEVAFICGQSRGKGVAEQLKGNADHIGISDGYGVYRDLFGEGKHQLCWAHPHRKFRDLTESKSLTEEKRKLCIKMYEDFSKLYADVRETLKMPFEKEKRNALRKKFLKRLDRMAEPNENDPKKLATLKESLRKNREAYFVCLVSENVPCDNNQAERAIRPLVLKRKNSLGSKTQRGAEVFSVLASVWYSLFRKDPRTVFAAIGLVGA
jgi:transposase